MLSSFILTYFAVNHTNLPQNLTFRLKGLVNLQKLFETLHDLNDSDEKTRILKTASKYSNRVKSYASFKIMQISI